MEVTIKFIDNGNPVVLTGDMADVICEERYAPSQIVRTLWFDMDDELGCNYEVVIWKLNDSIYDWHVSHAFHWIPGEDCYAWEISSHDTKFEMMIE